MKLLPLFMARNYTLLPLSLFIILSLSIQKCKCQSDFPSANLLCISDCETCPVICSPPPSPPSPSSPPPTPKLPPLLPPAPESPPSHHYPPPQPYFDFVAPPPSSTSPPPPRSKSPPSSQSTTPPPPPPPQVYVYSPGSNTNPARNFSYPYYYFYAANAASALPIFHGSFIFVMIFVFFINFV